MTAYVEPKYARLHIAVFCSIKVLVLFDVSNN
jgi:hypothetical protein